MTNSHLKNSGISISENPDLKLVFYQLTVTFSTATSAFATDVHVWLGPFCFANSRQLADTSQHHSAALSSIFVLWCQSENTAKGSIGHGPADAAAAVNKPPPVMIASVSVDYSADDVNRWCVFWCVFSRFRTPRRKRRGTCKREGRHWRADWRSVGRQGGQSTGITSQ